MLKELNIKNIAVIKEANLSFIDGLNIFTGETGAGKSILIGAISMVLGLRTSKDLIRTGEEKASVSALFTNVSKSICKSISELGFDCPDGEVLLYREITQDSSFCRINGIPSTTSILKNIGALLMNIHGQMDTQMLFSTDSHMKFIDSYGNLKNDVDNYYQKYSEYIQLNKKYLSLLTDERERASKIDLYSYQINEIEAADLKINEDIELSEKKNFFKNFEIISKSLNESKNLLLGNDSINGIVSSLDDVIVKLSKGSGIVNEIDEYLEKINEYKYGIEDLAENIRHLSDNIDFDQNELEYIEERLDLISRLKKKYGNSIEDILSYYEKIKSEFEFLTSFDESVDKIEKEVCSLKNEAYILANNLSNKRKIASKSFIFKVKSELEELDMPKVSFDVNFNEKELSLNGIDDVEFLLSVNPGEDLKPMSKIASGGEMSRIMLAIKNVVSGTDDIGTLIFDEIDTGISGRAAQKVGAKLSYVSKDRQIICVTHLAQVAAFADNHFLIEKNIKDDKTYTSIESLDYNGRIMEIARIMNGQNISDLALENAKQLISISKKDIGKGEVR